MRPRVLIADDSAYVRMSLSQSLRAHGFEVVGEATNGEEAVELNISLQPDIVLLDLQMPVMDGVEATRRILRTRTVPILVFASMDARGAQLAIAALAEGAYDVIAKRGPGGSAVDIAPHLWGIVTREPQGPPPRRAHAAGRPDVIVLASSTGGPACVEMLVTALPAGFPVPMLVAQHMPAGFTRSLAERLDTLSEVRVFEPLDGDIVQPGEVAILAGGQVSTIARAGRGSSFRVHVGLGEGVFGAKPNASALFFSALGAAEDRVLGIVLTGMGADASDAVRALVAAGAIVIAQEASEAVIPSMPNAARHAGAQRSLRMTQIREYLLDVPAMPEVA